MSKYVSGLKDRLNQVDNTFQCKSEDSVIVEDLYCHKKGNMTHATLGFKTGSGNHVINGVISEHREREVFIAGLLLMECTPLPLSNQGIFPCRLFLDNLL